MTTLREVILWFSTIGCFLASSLFAVAWSFDPQHHSWLMYAWAICAAVSILCYAALHKFFPATNFR